MFHATTYCKNFAILLNWVLGEEGPSAQDPQEADGRAAQTLPGVPGRFSHRKVLTYATCRASGIYTQCG